jgi:hypothetical protein
MSAVEKEGTLQEENARNQREDQNKPRKGTAISQ